MTERDPQQHNCTECQPTSQVLCITFISALGQALCDLDPRYLTIIPDEFDQPDKRSDGGTIAFIETG